MHGSAPDIAGKGIANPIAMIASFGMALRYSFGMGEEADLLDAAIAAVLAKRLAHRRHQERRLRRVVSTSEMGEAIVAALTKAL